MPPEQSIPPRINIDEAIALLKSGYTRWESEAFEPNKSIQAHFSLSFTQCKLLFSYAKIKGLKVAQPALIIVDGTNEIVMTNNQSAPQAIDPVHEEGIIVTENITMAAPIPTRRRRAVTEAEQENNLLEELIELTRPPSDVEYEEAVEQQDSTEVPSIIGQGVTTFLDSATPTNTPEQSVFAMDPGYISATPNPVTDEDVELAQQAAAIMESIPAPVAPSVEAEEEPQVSMPDWEEEVAPDQPAVSELASATDFEDSVNAQADVAAVVTEPEESLFD